LDSKEDAMFYLQDIEQDKLAEIGQVLGLSFGTLFSLMKSGNFLEGMIITWLKKKDQVDTPTWKSLGSVLQRMGFTKAVEKITKGILAENCVPMCALCPRILLQSCCYTNIGLSLKCFLKIFACVRLTHRF
jgi:hypothetical protein